MQSTTGKTVGVVGTGKIGAFFAEIMRGFGCNILGYDIYRDEELVKRVGLKYVELDELLASSGMNTLSSHLHLLISISISPSLFLILSSSFVYPSIIDIISIHAPLTKGTYHMLNADNIPKIKQGAVIINTSRGALVDTKPLIKALKAKQL